MEAQLEARHKKIVADREARRKRLAEVEAKAKEEGTWGKWALYEGTIPGFIYFPGTKTQFRFGGYARLDAIHNFNNMPIPLKQVTALLFGIAVQKSHITQKNFVKPVSKG